MTNKQHQCNRPTGSTDLMPGSDLDYAVARRVLRLDVTLRRGGVYWRRERVQFGRIVWRSEVLLPSFSTNVSAAFQLVERMKQRGWYVTIVEPAPGQYGHDMGVWMASFWHGALYTSSHMQHANALPVAICRAALAVVKENDDQAAVEHNNPLELVDPNDVSRVQRPTLAQIGRAKRRGQALVETSLMLLFLMLLLAAAVDAGRWFYTAGVVADMANEGATYGALYPERDMGDGSCSRLPLSPEDTIQERVRAVAKAHGLVISEEDLRSQDIVATIPGGDKNCRLRCLGTPIRVQVTYRVNTLFFAGLLNISSVAITKSSEQYITRNTVTGGDCQ